jgi:NTE family protein
MFGAYHAGACEVLLQDFQPDFFVGASIGALHAWALAGGCTGHELIEMWQRPGADMPLRFPRSPLGGMVDPTAIDERIQELYQRFRPEVPVGAVATDLRRLRPVLFRDSEITWRHLAASCAVLGFLLQQKLDGRVYSDGGLLHPLPLWAAAEMGATRIVAINAMTRMPAPIRTAVSFIRAAAPWTPPKLEHVEVITIKPKGLLGSAHDAMYWKRENIQLWIDQGRRDAESYVKLSTGPT